MFLLLQFLEAAGVQAVICNDTVAEYAALTLEERQRLLRFCRRRFSGQIINHVSANALQDAAQLMTHSATTLCNEAGRYVPLADAVLLQPPFRYGDSEAGTEVS
jgi:dihydrodipicolinate synthase/N-acetylneuraminate lyase